jgi:FkbM family methyltransferase
MSAVWADAASRETPVLTRTDRGPRPPQLPAPRALTRTWRRGLARVRSGRLPPMIATFSDGRRFRIDRGDLMYQQIYRLGEYEPVVTRTIRAVLRPGDFAVDLGANHGWFALVMAHAVGPMGEVWAIEPGAAMVAALKSNLELNAELPIRVHRVAVADTSGEVLLHHFADLPHGHASTSALGHENFDTERVPCQALDDLLAETRTPPALIKLDVEGSERAVLQGAARLLAAHASMWAVEVNHETSAAFGYTPASLLNAFPDDHGVFRVQDGGLVPEDDPAAAPHGTMWLCVPPALLHRTDGLIAA